MENGYEMKKENIEILSKKYAFVECFSSSPEMIKRFGVKIGEQIVGGITGKTGMLGFKKDVRLLFTDKALYSEKCNCRFAYTTLCKYVAYDGGFNILLRNKENSYKLYAYSVGSFVNDELNLILSILHEIQSHVYNNNDSAKSDVEELWTWVLENTSEEIKKKQDDALELILAMGFVPDLTIRAYQDCFELISDSIIKEEFTYSTESYFGEISRTTVEIDHDLKEKVAKDFKFASSKWKRMIQENVSFPLKEGMANGYKKIYDDRYRFLNEKSPIYKDLSAFLEFVNELAVEDEKYRYSNNFEGPYDCKESESVNGGNEKQIEQKFND